MSQDQATPATPEVPKRTKETIWAEYAEWSNRAADHGYRIEIMKDELHQIHKEMFKLNQEAKALGLLAVAGPVEAIK